MTFGELIVFNSTLPSDSGFTVVEHLQNIDRVREVYSGVEVDVGGNTEINLVSAIITANVQAKKLEIDLSGDDGIVIDSSNTDVAHDSCS